LRRRLVLALLLTCAASSLRADEKIPAPAPEIQAEIRGRVLAEWKDEAARTDPKSILALAEKLEAQAEATLDDPATRYVLEVEAMTLATRAGDFEKAAATGRAIHERFDAPELPDVLARAFAERMRQAERAAEFRDVAEGELASPVLGPEQIALAKRWNETREKALSDVRHLAARRVRRWIVPALVGLDAKSRAELETTLQRAEDDVEKADARAQRFTLFEGRWLVAYDDGALAAYVIAADGSISCDERVAADCAAVVVPEKERRLGKLGRRDGDVLAPRAGDRKLQRLSIRSDALLVEVSDPNASKAERAAGAGRGVRDAFPPGAAIALRRARMALRQGRHPVAVEALEAAKRAAEGDAHVARARTPLEVAAKVLGFALRNKGKQVGDGECWTLADQALNEAGSSAATSSSSRARATRAATASSSSLTTPRSSCAPPGAA
jgi:hypothetical protein